MMSVLYVDDEKPLLELAKSFLEMKGLFTVETTTSAEKALQLLETHSYEAIISDYQMPGMNGIAFLKQVRNVDKNIPFILFTGRGREEVVIEALNEGADHYLQKGGDTVSLFAELSHRLMLAIEKRRAEIALKQSEEQSRILMSHIQDGVFLAQDEILLMCNDMLAVMMGYTREEIIGKHITCFIAPEDREMVLKRHNERLAGNKLTEIYEFRLLHKDGIIRVPVRMSVGTGIYKGHPAVIGTLHNMTEERERESAQKRSEKRYREIYNNADIGLITATLDGRFLRANPYAIKCLGYDSEEDLIQSIPSINSRYVNSDERDELYRILKEKGFFHNYITRFYRKDGKIIWGSISARIVRDDFGENIIEGTCKDITDRMEAELALRESERRLLWVYESGLIGVMFYTMDGRITEANDTFLAMTGYTRDDLQAGLINGFALTPPEYAEVDNAAVTELMKSGVHKRPYEKEYIRKDGERVPVVLAGSMLDSERTQGVGFVLDISERKKTEINLLKANQQLNILTDITRHDINNEISLIYGFIDLASPLIVDPELQGLFLKIKSATNRIKNQIAFTRIYQELGSKAPSWQKITSVLPYSEIPGNVIFHAEIPDMEIYADQMLEKVFYNLLDNSLRHGRRVTIIRMICREKEGILTLTFEDNGVGIPNEQKQRIFERGYGSNTGLGLFLVREILDQTGITIQETGEFGTGARFEIHIPTGTYRTVKEHQN